MFKDGDRFHDPEHIRWAAAVKKRDDYECQICESTGTYLHSHHINSWDIYVELRFDTDNGITLCPRCHHRFHIMYGYGHNNELQFNEFRLIAESFKRIIRKRREGSSRVADPIRASSIESTENRDDTSA